MENWMQKYENNKEKTEEDTLQIQLTELIDLVDNAKYYEESKMIEELSKIISSHKSNDTITLSVIRNGNQKGEVKATLANSNDQF